MHRIWDVKRAEDELVVGKDNMLIAGELDCNLWGALRFLGLLLWVMCPNLLPPRASPPAPPGCRAAAGGPVLSRCMITGAAQRGGSAQRGQFRALVYPSARASSSEQNHFTTCVVLS